MNIIIGLVTMVMAVDGAARGCGTLQILKVKAQWEKAYGIGKMRDDFGLAVWRSVFALDPSVRPMFDRVHGDDMYDPEFTAHSARVFSGLDALIALIDEPDTYGMQVDHLKYLHKENNLAANHFGLMKTALMRVIPASLDFCFDHDAWDACLDFILEGLGQQ